MADEPEPHEGTDIDANPGAGETTSSFWAEAESPSKVLSAIALGRVRGRITVNDADYRDDARNDADDNPGY
jgi:hypothetical protein